VFLSNTRINPIILAKTSPTGTQFCASALEI
jgi:hypothetical protein